MLKFEKLPSSDRIDQIISDYKIIGMAKNSLIIIRDALLNDFEQQNSVCVNMDIETFKTYSNALNEIKKLREEIEILKTKPIYKILLEKIKTATNLTDLKQK